MRLTWQVKEKGSSVATRTVSSWKVLSSWKSFSDRTRAPPPPISRTLQEYFWPERERICPSTPVFWRKKFRFSML